jgi:chemotaxis protein methyltransferase CheR
MWTASSELAKNIEFMKLNLKDSFSFSEKFDLVLCRNVLIYQGVEGKIDILNRITATLAPGGLLILGSGESLLGLSEAYEQVSSEGVVMYRKKEALLRAG